MDFQQWKQKNTKNKADFNNPWMGLNGVVCEEPAYWCRLHEVWLSENDAARKRCLSRLTYDMIGYHRCNNLECKEKNPFLTKKE